MSDASDKSAWALGLDYGYEGRQPPLTLFADAEEAMAAKALMERNHGTSVYCVRVPYWPAIRDENNETAP